MLESVRALAVYPTYQNHGVAHQTYEVLRNNRLKKRGFTSFFLRTVWDMKEAIRPYESLGYVKEGYLRRHFYGEDFIVFS
jgi:GNAT superfamily N-acetyltransferase